MLSTLVRALRERQLPMHARPPLPTLRARIALWLAPWVYVLGFFGGAWHGAAEAHIVCEHGELVHAGEGHGASRDAHAPSEDAVPRLDPRGEEPGAEDHEHCPIWSSAHRPALDTGPAPGIAWISESRIQAGRARTHPEAAFPLFLLAPAHSPPAS